MLQLDVGADQALDHVEDPDVEDEVIEGLVMGNRIADPLDVRPSRPFSTTRNVRLLRVTPRAARSTSASAERSLASSRAVRSAGTTR